MPEIEEPVGYKFRVGDRVWWTGGGGVPHKDHVYVVERYLTDVILTLVGHPHDYHEDVFMLAEDDDHA